MILYLVIKGGLGNQLFQAALGVALEQRFGAEVCYLTHGFKGDNYRRDFLLDHFPALAGRSVAPEECAGLPVYRESAGQAPAVTLAEIGRLIEAGADRLILDGYWQSELYFRAAREAIRAAFRLTPGEKLEAIGHGLRARSMIGIHVRRADYGHHGLPKSDFFRQSLARIRQQAGNLPALVFTDEYNFCCFEFGKITDLNVVRGDSSLPLNDFYLLQHCRHFVLSNSSFSWWSAWLGEEEGAIIEVPLPWCIFDRTVDPVPERWHRTEDAVKRQ